MQFDDSVDVGIGREHGGNAGGDDGPDSRRLRQADPDVRAAPVWAAGGQAAFGFFFSLVPLAFSALTFTFLLQDPWIGPGNLGHRALFLAAPLIVVAVSLGISGIGLAKLIRGYAAIRRNKRDRERRLGEMR